MNPGCLNETDLLALLDGSSSREATAIAVRHLDNCESCRIRLEEANRSLAVSQDLAGLADREQLPDGIDEVLMHLSQQQRQRVTSASSTLETLTPDTEGNALGLFREFEVLEVAGRGGMGVVFKARDQRLDRIVAIKSMNLPDLPDLKSRFAREVRAAAAVVHDNVVSIYAAGEHNGIPFLVMEYVAGETLAEIIDQQGPVQVDRFIELAKQITAGLEAVHRKGLVHRDLKPANVIIDETGKAMLTDFGLAKSVQANGLTATGTLLGTPAYMSPEQAREEEVDYRSDLFSLGATFYAMLTGVDPFTGSSTYEVLDAVCNAEPIPIRDIRSNIPQWVVTLIQQLLEKDPSRRCPTTSHVQETLASADQTPQPSAATPSKRRRTVLGVVGVGLLTMIVAAYAGLFRKKDDFVLRRNGQRFSSLHEAIAAASNNDVVEICGRGPYVLDSIDLGNRSLTIQAGRHQSPVLRVSKPNAPLFVTRGTLKLAGLEIENLHPSSRFDGEWTNPQEALVLVSASGRFDAAFCRFRLGENRPCVYHAGKQITFRNCMIGGTDSIWLLWDSHPGSTVTHINNFIHAKIGVAVRAAKRNRDDRRRAACHLLASDNTLQNSNGYLWIMGNASSWIHSLNVTFENNVVETNAFVTLRPTFSDGRLTRDVSSNATRWFDRTTSWQDRNNLYVNVHSFLKMRRRSDLATSLKEWLSICGVTQGRRDASQQISSGKLARISQEQVVGADPRQLGPGEPFHDWSSTLEYDSWLNTR